MKAKLDLLKPRVGSGALLGLGLGIGFAVPVSFILWFIELVDTGREISDEKMMSGVVSCGLFGAAS